MNQHPVVELFRADGVDPVSNDPLIGHPIPWRVQSEAVPGTGANIVIDVNGAAVLSCLDEVTARRITKAVNMHARLLVALKQLADSGKAPAGSLNRAEYLQILSFARSLIAEARV